MKPRYDDKFRAGALIMLAAQGYPQNEHALAEVARHLRIPDRTLRRWYKQESNPVPDDVVRESKKELHQRLETLAHKLIDSMLGNTDDASLQQQAVSLGIAIEKMQLLRQEPTERVAMHHELSEDERRARLATLLERARQERTRQLAAGETIQ